MHGQLVLWADEEFVSTRLVVDTTTGEVQPEQVSARDLCASLRIHYCPMTEAVKQIELYKRKAKAGEDAPAPVTLGDLGPFVLARVADGAVQNGYGVHDIPKPMRLSAETLRDLARIFGSARKTTPEKT